MSGERKVKYLLPPLLAAYMGYLGLLYIEQRLDERDYSVIPNAELRVGFCMITSISPYEKYALAKSIARPPFSPKLFSVVLAQALAGETTPLKVSAIKALDEREDLQRRAAQIAIHIAGRCGYDRIAHSDQQTPLQTLQRWLPHDDGYSYFVRQEKQAGSDPAEQLYKLALSSNVRTGSELTMGDCTSKGVSAYC